MINYIILLIIVGFILYISKYINKTKINREKITAYECGFQEFDEARKKYYIKFYLIAILFLIFDLETILLYPLSIYNPLLTSLGYYLFVFFIFILSLGLAIEINKSIILY